jgi:hypothetical protein
MELNMGADLGQFDGKDLGNGGGQSLDAAYGGFPRIGATGSVDYRVCLARFKPESMVNCLPCGHLFHRWGQARRAPVGDADAGDGERGRDRSGGNGGRRLRRTGATAPRQLGGGAVKP